MIATGARFSGFVECVARLNVQAAILAVLVAVACWLCGRRIAPRWRSMLWLLVFVRLTIPVGPASFLSLSNLFSNPTGAAAAPFLRSTPSAPTAPVPALDAVPLMPDRPVAPPSVESNVVVTESARWSWLHAFVAVWLTVATLLLMRLLMMRIRLARQLAGMADVDDPNIIEFARASATLARVVRLPHLVWGPSAGSPAVSGWWSPVILLPRSSAVMEPQALRSVLLHEFGHIRSADTLLMWLPRICCAVFWFNPLLWWGGRKWHEEREMACDEWVLERIGSVGKQQYFEALVTIASEVPPVWPPLLAASMSASPTLLERRIIAMKRHQPYTWKNRLVGALLLMGFGLAGLTDPVRAEKTLNTPSGSQELTAEYFIGQIEHLRTTQLPCQLTYRETVEANTREQRRFLDSIGFQPGNSHEHVWEYIQSDKGSRQRLLSYHRNGKADRSQLSGSGREVQVNQPVPFSALLFGVVDLSKREQPLSRATLTWDGEFPKLSCHCEINGTPANCEWWLMKTDDTDQSWFPRRFRAVLQPEEPELQAEVEIEVTKFVHQPGETPRIGEGTQHFTLDPANGDAGSMTSRWVIESARYGDALEQSALAPLTTLPEQSNAENRTRPQ